MSKGVVLVLYYHTHNQLRASSRDLLYCFSNHTDMKVIYVNIAWGLPFYLKFIDVDLIVFHEPLMTKRNIPSRFERISEILKNLKNENAYRVAFVQDEMSYTRSLARFINEHHIDHIFSVAPASEWKKIYDGINFSRIKFTEMLTGYLDDQLIDQVEELSKKVKERDILVGYRANFSNRFSLGSHGLLKYKIGKLFQAVSEEKKWNSDISMDTKDTLLGDAWFVFLLRCKFTLGAESGASVLDPNGVILDAVTEHLKNHPSDSFDEVKKIFFEKEDGELKLFALGPRHLEACVTRTCQILYEGDFNGVLKPGQHYISLKHDHSNLEEVLSTMQNKRIVSEIVENAYREIALNPNYRFSSFVKQSIEVIRQQHKFQYEITGFSHLYVELNRIREKISWCSIWGITQSLNAIKKILPQRVFNLLLK